MEGKRSSLGMEANLAAALSYLLGWLSGLIIFLLEKDNAFVRFHAAQSILVFGALTLLYVLVPIAVLPLALIPFFGAVISTLLGAVIYVGSLILWILLMVQAFQGKWTALPVVGAYARKMAGLETFPS